jgi:hypothetical protein
VCAVTAGGLTPGASYSYVPQANGVALRSAVDVPRRPPEPPFRFGVVGDTGTGSSAQMAVRDRMLAGGLDLLVHTGDMIYDHGALADQDPKFFTPYKDLIRQLVFWPVMGNHDFEDAGDVEPGRLHAPPTTAAHDDTYYSFDRGNAPLRRHRQRPVDEPGQPAVRVPRQDLARARRSGSSSSSITRSTCPRAPARTSARTCASPSTRTASTSVFMGHVHCLRALAAAARRARSVAPGAGTVYVTTWRRRGAAHQRLVELDHGVQRVGEPLHARLDRRRHARPSR